MSSTIPDAGYTCDQEEMIDLSVRLLSGEVKHFSVPPETPLRTIKQQLEVEQKVPRWHEIYLLAGDTELCEESDVRHLRLLAATAAVIEVQAVTVAVIEEAVGAVSSALPMPYYCSESFKREARNLQEAIDFLVRFEEIDKTSEESLRSYAREFFDIYDINVLEDLFIKDQDSAALSWVSMSRLVVKFGDVHLEAELLNQLKNVRVQEFLPSSMIGELKQAISKKRARQDAGQQSHADADVNARAELCTGDTAEAEAADADIERQTDGEVAAVGDRDASAAAGYQLSEDIEVAIRRSAAEAAAQEGAQIQEALLRSKIEAAQQQVITVLRLSKRNTNVLDALLQDEVLQKAQAQVEEAGCEILPEWADGAIVLAPLTEKDLTDAGVKLRAHHVVIPKCFQSHVEQALSAIRPKKRRPLVQQADPDYLQATVPETPESREPVARGKEGLPNGGTDYVVPSDIEWRVEHTFVHCPLPRAECSSRSVQSEPWGGATDALSSKLPPLPQ